MNRLKKIAVVTAVMATLLSVGNTTVLSKQMSDTNLTAVGYYIYGDFDYSIYTDGTCIIDKYLGTAETITIPSVINGYKVIRLGNEAFAGNTKVKKVILPDTITEMYGSVFKDCSNLETINTPDSLKKIMSFCFENCYKLKSFDLNNVESLGINAFRNCKSLEEIYVPGTIEVVPGLAFGGCTNLKTLTFADGVKEIGNMAAFDTPSLEKVTISGSVEKIDSYAIGYTQYNYQSGGYTLILSIDNLKEYNFVEGSAAEKYGIDNGIIKVFEGEFSYENNFIPSTPSIIFNKLGDTDGNGAIDSSDASIVLAEYSAVQTGKKETFTAMQKNMADVNRDDTIDAADASEILRYYAEASTGKNPVWSFVADIPAKINRSENS